MYIFFFLPYIQEYYFSSSDIARFIIMVQPYNLGQTTVHLIKYMLNIYAKEKNTATIRDLTQSWHNVRVIGSESD